MQTIKEKYRSVHEQIIKTFEYEKKYNEKLASITQSHEKCYKKILHAKNLTELLYNMYNILYRAGFEGNNIYWALKEAMKDALDIENPGISASQRNTILKPIFDKLRAYEKQIEVIRTGLKDFEKEIATKMAQEKTAKITMSFFDLIKNWFKSWYQ